MSALILECIANYDLLASVCRFKPVAKCYFCGKYRLCFFTYHTSNSWLQLYVHVHGPITDTTQFINASLILIAHAAYLTYGTLN